MHVLSPSDIVGPSPVTSNGTETTEIEDDVADDVELDQAARVNHYHHSDVSSINTHFYVIKHAHPNADLTFL